MVSLGLHRCMVVGGRKKKKEIGGFFLFYFYFWVQFLSGWTHADSARLRSRRIDWPTDRLPFSLPFSSILGGVFVRYPGLIGGWRGGGKKKKLDFSWSHDFTPTDRSTALLFLFFFFFGGFLYGMVVA